VLRALLREPSTTIAGDHENGVVFSAADDVGYVWGIPPVQELTRARRWVATLLMQQHVPAIAPDLQWEKITLFVNQTPSGASTPEGVRPLKPGDAPHEIRAELLGAEERGPVFVSLDEGKAAAFAFIKWQSEHHYELWVYTIPKFRRRGHAQRAARALLAERHRAGYQAVWSARDSDVGAAKLAEQLGFQVADSIYQGRRRS
jgi:GNAT superfamily N-acetyltransferase